jgi:hypothetical protein
VIVEHGYDVGTARRRVIDLRRNADSACSREHALDRMPAATSAIEPAVSDVLGARYRTRVSDAHRGSLCHRQIRNIAVSATMSWWLVR